MSFFIMYFTKQKIAGRSIQTMLCCHISFVSTLCYNTFVQMIKMFQKMLLHSFIFHSYVWHNIKCFHQWPSFWMWNQLNAWMQLKKKVAGISTDNKAQVLNHTQKPLHVHRLSSTVTLTTTVKHRDAEEGECDIVYHKSWVKQIQTTTRAFQHGCLQYRQSNKNRKPHLRYKRNLC